MHPLTHAHIKQQPEDVNSPLTIKLATQYASSRDVESMRAIARAHQGRNLAEFEKALRDYQLGMSLFCFP
jgi:26S proteasome regulatory subunit N6